MLTANINYSLHSQGHHVAAEEMTGLLNDQAVSMDVDAFVA